MLLEKYSGGEGLTIEVFQRQDGEDAEDAHPATGHSNLHAKPIACHNSAASIACPVLSGSCSEQMPIIV